MSLSQSAVRLGIDVGGTFTHAVALDAKTLNILGHIKVPTTHTAAAGVAQGVIEALQHLLNKLNIQPENISFIAHSTTQATNALLEGDVAVVGILGMGKGATAWLSAKETKLGNIYLGHGHFLKTHHYFIDTSGGINKNDVIKGLKTLQEAGSQVIVISEAFSVDDSQNEDSVLLIAQELGLCATAGSVISKLYGLRTRTRTAALNAAMIPKMLETAALTEKAVREAKINAPLMIMRSDGGVMDIKAMRERPILTMLSGPAAGVAAATMFLRISDGIFLEVGGTSTDISAIKNGRVRSRYAEIGGHRLHMRTIDIRTVAVAGGSMARSNGKKIDHLGPRSAHIAGLTYAAFTDNLNSTHIKLIAPKENDSSDYLVLSSENKIGGEQNAALSEQKQVAITTTCAANYLNLVPEGDPAAGNKESVEKAFDTLSAYLKYSASDCAKAYLDLANKTCAPIVQELVKSQKLDPQTITLYGGGGGAAAIVPYLSAKLRTRFELADKADVISAIGVALALVQETVERQMVKPSQEDILKLREQAYIAVHEMGADPASIQVFVEIDTQTNVVRATATGASSAINPDSLGKQTSQEEILAKVALSLHVPKEQIIADLKTDFFTVYKTGNSNKKKYYFWERKNTALRVVDIKGVIRFQAQNGEAILTKKSSITAALNEVINRLSNWGDAGKTIPHIMLLAGIKIIDLSGLTDSSQLVSMAHAELELFPAEGDIVIIASKN